MYRVLFLILLAILIRSSCGDSEHDDANPLPGAVRAERQIELVERDYQFDGTHIPRSTRPSYVVLCVEPDLVLTATKSAAHWNAILERSVAYFTIVSESRCVGSSGFIKFDSSLLSSEWGYAEFHFRSNQIQSITIRINPTLSPSCYQSVMDHEFGHVVGVGHDEEGIMASGLCSPTQLMPSARTMSQIKQGR